MPTIMGKPPFDMDYMIPRCLCGCDCLMDGWMLLKGLQYRPGHERLKGCKRFWSCFTCKEQDCKADVVSEQLPAYVDQKLYTDGMTPDVRRAMRDRRGRETHRIGEPQKVSSTVFCPKCNNGMVKRGLTEDGRQRYKCTFCSSSSLLRHDTLPCPYCSGSMTKKGFTKDGRQRWECSACSKSTIGFSRELLTSQIGRGVKIS